MRVKIVPYVGLVINSRNTSSFLINPTIPAALDLRSWLYDNMDAVNDLLNSGYLVAKARDFGREATDALTTISAVSEKLHLRIFNLNCKLKLIDYKQSFVFMTCDSCNGKTTAPFQTSYTCNFCNKSGVISTPRLRAKIHVQDSTGVIPATLLGPDAETFLGCSVDTLHHNSLLTEPQPVQTLIKSESEGDVHIQLRVYTSEYQDVTRRKFGASFVDAPSLVIKIKSELIGAIAP